MAEKKVPKDRFKATLFMPDTAFEMRANLVAKEPHYRQLWQDKMIYQKALRQNRKAKPFLLHDGPPYANGSLHVGHALNKILKDIVVRHKTIMGFYAPFVAGWDTHGLPIENKVLSEMKATKDDLDKLTLRHHAAIYAQSQVAQQKAQFQMMNLFTDFHETYLTMDKGFEAAQLQLFKKMYFDGLVYKGLRPVYWSPTLQSALAEAEIEYQETTSPQVIVAFALRDEPNTALTIMTTTPWTLPANAGIAVGRTITYDFIRVDHRIFIVASALAADVSAAAGWKNGVKVKTLTGQELIGKIYTHPLTGNHLPVVAGHHVVTDTGTGLVHIAPLFGEDDFIIGKECGLEMVMHVNDQGILQSEAGEFAGQFYLDANKAIGMRLQALDVLVSLKFVKHQYPHDWRTHKPVIFRGTPQWFVSIDKIKKTILKQLQKVHSVPDWGVKRLAQMIEGRHDWTISRQRAWGVPIIIFYDRNGQELREQAVFDYVIALIAKHGSDVWFTKKADELLPPSYRGLGYTKEEDIMDVWFDSGASSIAVKPGGLVPPFDLYLEGADQYRGWFNSSLVNSVAYRGIAPFRQIVSHGFVLDGKQQKMSKSKGNVIDPLTIIEQHGADILRLWVASTEFTSDVTLSEDIIRQTMETYRNIRTKLRFLLGNLKGWKETMRQERLTGYDAVIAEKLANLKHTVQTAYNDYRFATVIKEISNFITELSSFYLDYTKDALYADAHDKKSRLAILTNLHDIARFIIIALAPVLVTTMEEAYAFLPAKGKKSSVHLESTPYDGASSKTTHQKRYAALLVLRDAVYRDIEVAKRNIGIRRSQEIHFNVTTQEWQTLCATAGATYDVALLRHAANLFMVGKLTCDDKLPWGIATWESAKCARCWNHFDLQDVRHDLCRRCTRLV